MIRSALMLTTFLLIVTSTAHAQRWYPSREQKWEFTIQTRYTVEQEFSGEGGSSIKLKDDLGWGFGFAYNMSQNWSFGFGFAWRSIPYTAIIVDQADPQNKREYSGDLDFSTIALSGVWNVLRGRFTPYATGNLGMTFIDTNIFAGTGTGCWWDPWFGPVCGTFPTTYGKTGGSFTIGAGLRAELSDNFFLRGGYEYGRTKVESVEGTSMIRGDIGFLF